MAIKAIIFDIDGVLADSRRAVVHNTRELMREFGFVVPDEKIEKMSSAHSAETVLLALAPELKGNGALLRQMLARLSQLTAENLHLISPLPVVEAVPSLSKRYLLAVATNRRASANMVLERLGIRHYFSAVITSADAPPKPDPTMLKIACERLRITPGQAIFIGDNEEDRLAGSRAGVQTWLVGDDIKRFMDEKLRGL
ncbi:MAG: HAD family hydrolase [Candidatus Micrarchaeota archaeon]|nr:HAD family hydrolase [Candidatus Micrarchaeota archaeon]